jgi:DivIVA domain-containing protein
VIDESFHLTPLDVRRTEFPAALRGYDRARVDEFRDRVANELERLTRLNHELENKAKGFHEQLRAFRERDKALNDALVSAQQLRQETKDQAEREAQLSLREAKADGDRLIDAAKSEARRLSGEIEGLERSRRAYLAQLRSLVARQLAEIDAIPTDSGWNKAPVPTTAGAAASAPPPPPPTAAPKTTTVPLPAVPPNGAEPDADDATPRQSVQTPGWLKAVPSDK